MLADLYQEQAITGWNSGDIPMTYGFGTGRYMMLLDGPRKVSELAGAYPDFKYSTAPVPAGDGGSISVLGGEDIGMFNTANKDAAWKFMKCSDWRILPLYGTMSSDTGPRERG